VNLRDSIPRTIEDSLRMRAVDSLAVRQLVRQLAEDGSTVFHYWWGGEQVVYLVWSPEHRRLLFLSMVPD
jgi:hypothetical protein